MMIRAPCWRDDNRAEALTMARIAAWISRSSLWLLARTKVPARPILSSARRISGANMTGIANKRAGSVVLTSQEKAGRSTRAVNSARSTIREMAPRKSTIAWVSRRRYSKLKNTSVTKRISMTLSKLMRWKMKNRSLNSSVISENRQSGWGNQPLIPDYQLPAALDGA